MHFQASVEMGKESNKAPSPILPTQRSPLNDAQQKTDSCSIMKESGALVRNNPHLLKSDIPKHLL